MTHFLCRNCKIKLVKDANWQKSLYNRNNKICTNCNKEKSKEYYKANKKKVLEYRKKYYEYNKEEIKIKHKKYVKENIEKVNKRKELWTKNNPEKVKKSQQKWLSNNPNKRKEANRNYYNSNKKECHSRSSKRRADRIKATPKWSELKEIKEFYKNCPQGYHVDHIYPLKSDKVCGLHVINNLQYLTAEENLSKGNKMPEEYYDN